MLMLLFEKAKTLAVTAVQSIRGIWTQGRYEALAQILGIPSPDDERRSFDECGSIIEAKKFAKEFHANPKIDDLTGLPREDHGYGWVCLLAEKQFNYAEKKAAELDNKATAVVGYLGSGTGLFTLGSIAAVTSNTASPLVVASAFPSIFFALFSIIFALRCRASTSFAFPSAVVATQYVDFFKNQSEANFIGQWEIATVRVEEVGRRKALMMDRCQVCFFVAVACLILPLVVGMCVQTQKVAPPSIEVIHLVKDLP